MASSPPARVWTQVCVCGLQLSRCPLSKDAGGGWWPGLWPLPFIPIPGRWDSPPPGCPTAAGWGTECSGWCRPCSARPLRSPAESSPWPGHTVANEKTDTSVRGEESGEPCYIEHLGGDPQGRQTLVLHGDVMKTAGAPPGVCRRMHPTPSAQPPIGKAISIPEGREMDVRRLPGLWAAKQLSQDSAHAELASRSQVPAGGHPPSPESLQKARKAGPIIPNGVKMRRPSHPGRKPCTPVHTPHELGSGPSWGLLLPLARTRTLMSSVVFTEQLL